MWRWWRRTSPKEQQNIEDAEKDYTVFKARVDADIQVEQAQRAVAESRKWNKTLEEIRSNNHFRELFIDNLGG